MKPNNLLLAVFTAGILSGCGKQEDATVPAPPPVSVNATNVPVPAASRASYEKLPGKWLRPDGGYILEIRSVAPDGKMDARYFNPRPINVAKAEASQEGASVKVFIELRDVNYPGSTYTLTYDSTNDRLYGIYFQAALRERFEVSFGRLK